MTWFKTINHRGEEVDIASIDGMNAVVDAFEARLDEIAIRLDSHDREMRRAAVAEYEALMSRRERIEQDVRRANAIIERDAEDRYHRDLAQAIRERVRP